MDSTAGSTSTNLMQRPLLTSKFWVEMSGVFTAFFTECNGLQMNTEVAEYKEGGLNSHTHKLPLRTSFSNITLKRGLTTSSEFWDWYMATVRLKVQRRNISIILYSGQDNGQEARRWDVRGAYPVKWIGPDFKATDGQAHTIETIELVHNGFTMLKA